MPSGSLLSVFLVSRCDQLECPDDSLGFNPVLHTFVRKHYQAHCQQQHQEEDIVHDGLQWLQLELLHWLLSDDDLRLALMLKILLESQVNVLV